MLSAKVAFRILALNVVLLVAGSAGAQSLIHRFEIFTEGGTSTSNQFTTVQPIFVSLQPLQFDEVTVKSSLRTTGRLFTGIRLWLDNSQALEVSYSYSPSSLVSSFACTPSCGVGNRAIPLYANFFAGNYVHTLPRAGDFRPFITAGAGGLFLWQQYAGSVRHDPFAVNLGGGFDRRLAGHWSLRAEARDWIFDMPHLGNSGSGLAHNIVPSLGPVFRF